MDFSLRFPNRIGQSKGEPKMNTKSNIARTIICCVLIASISLPVLFFVQTYYEKRQAQRLIHSLQYLRVGVTTEQEALNIFSAFHPDEQRMGGRIKDFHVEGPGYSVSNSRMVLLHLEPPATFSISLFFYQGILVAKNAGLDRSKDGICCSVEVSEATEEFSTLPPAMMPHGLYLEERGDGTAGLILVHIDNHASEDTRKAAYNFNFSCLTAISGCKDANELLPHIRQVADKLRMQTQ